MTPKSPDRGLYFHIPFCHARCGYCDFVTFTGKEDRIDQYVEDICAEIRLYGAMGISTIFFGGGTPSLLEPRHVAQILEAVRAHFALDPSAEITMEANPESLTEAKAKGWRQAGVNRLSIGLQSFDNALLKAMDRLHTVEEFLAAFEGARRSGFDNVNVDLIYGFPGQSLANWQDTLRRTVALQPEHLSLYALKVEPHTPFHAQGVSVNDDEEADMYAWARTFLSANGYPQYEISNFALPGRECRHNLIYWRQQDYLGLGVGAVGCAGGLRWENHKNLLDYQKDIANAKLPRANVETLNVETLRFERLMLGLRLREGIQWDEESPEWISIRNNLVAKGMLEEVDSRPCLPTGRRWRISDPAVPLTNQVLLPFIP